MLFRSASGGQSYSWTPSTGLSSDTIANPLASPASNTEYIVTVSNGPGCDDVDTVLVTVLPAAIADAGVDVSICQGDTAQLNASGGITYSWSPATDIDDPTIPNPQVWPNLPTVYVVTVTDENGCHATDSVFIDVFAAVATGDTTLCFGDTAQLGVSPTGVSIAWYPSAYLSDKIGRAHV